MNNLADEYDGIFIGSVGKSAKTEVGIGIREYQQNRFIDIRMYYLEGGSWLPTRRGVTLPIETYPEFESIVTTLGEALGFDG